MMAALTNDIPFWRFPRSWSEMAEVAREALTPRERGDDVLLDGERASLVKDMLAVTQFAGSGILYQNAGKKAGELNDKFPPLADSPKVKLSDPLLIVPGWGTRPEKFDHLVSHLLSSGQNGERPVYIKDGKTYSDKECTQATAIVPDDKIFITVFESTLDSPDLSAPQLEKAVKTLKGSVSDKVDVLGYSMGGLSVRKMLQDDLDGDARLNQVALLGTASRGTRFATLAEYIIQRDINWAMSLGSINAAHLPAMAWLKAWNPERPESNPRLHTLNTNLDRQLSQADEFLSIASTGLSTLTHGWGGTTGGDGLVPAQSATLPGLPTKFLDGRGNKHHGNLPHDREVFAALTDYFGWQQLQEKPGSGG